MLEIKGKYNKALVYASEIDETTEEQIKVLVDQSFTKGSDIRIMPDCHAGSGCVIGTTMTITDKVVPNLVGVDIGCGMLTVILGNLDIDLVNLDKFINKYIPSGFNTYVMEQTMNIDITKLRCWDKVSNKSHQYKSIGTLGGGNHFIEIDQDESGIKYLIIHSGSRNLGNQVAKIYQEYAIDYHKNKNYHNIGEEAKKIVSDLQQQDRENEIDSALKQMKADRIVNGIPDDLCYLEGELFHDYLYDMNIAQDFAKENREIMATKIVDFLGLNFKDLKSFHTIHNYINMDDMILRKGAISAYSGEFVLIPINMRDGCILGKGKSCKEYNFSAPHGAGRLLSRRQARNQLSLVDFKDTMEGIYSTSVKIETLDESPFAYKPIDAIVDNIKDTVEIIEIIKPIYNFKSS